MNRYEDFFFSFRHFFHSPTSEIEVLGWCFLRFLHESMQYDQHSLVKAENEAGDRSAWQCRSNLPETILKTSDEGHSNWPAKLHAHQVQTNRSPISSFKATQPLQHRLSAVHSFIESNGNLGRALCLIPKNTSVSQMVRRLSGTCGFLRVSVCVPEYAYLTCIPNNFGLPFFQLSGGPLCPAAPSQLNSNRVPFSSMANPRFLAEKSLFSTIQQPVSQLPRSRCAPRKRYRRQSRRRKQPSPHGARCQCSIVAACCFISID